ncbi:MAG TPA: phospholipase D family protein [Burkholderiaceae bacterium]|nr:phospholipase D family protein [Burkholderiaceae bacterium]
MTHSSKWPRTPMRWALLWLAALIAGCAGLPPLQDRPSTHALQPSSESPLGRATLPQAQQHPGLTGVIPINDGRVAFGARVSLARAATRSIDVQTFIWHPDATGTLLFEEMVRAAERGVRVRLLLDDMNTAGTDATLALLASHPNIELRLYNPFVGRGSRTMGMLSDFTRLNHRMHNKWFTVDSAVSVVGGRNIANEYFEIGETGFVDLDVITIGDAVWQVSAEFDLFFNSASAYPAKMIIGGVTPEPRDELARRAQAIRDNPTTAQYAEAVAHTALVKGMLAGTVRPQWTTAKLVHDDPAKTLSLEDKSELQLLPKLQAAFGESAQSLDLVSPYFVPGETGTDALTALAKRGVRVRVITNSLAATDEKSVHAGYVKRRDDLLRAGVQLFEIKPDASDIVKRAGEIGRGAKAGLHAKTYTVDGRSIFVGSFNLDPRSSKLNTEMGLVIDSAELALGLSSFVDKAYPGLVYRVSLDADGNLQWEDGTGAVYHTDPGTGWFERAVVRIGSWLPIEWLL